MYVETREELRALLELIGYTESEEYHPTSLAWYPTMVHPKLPWVRLPWLNGCKMQSEPEFLTFDAAWRRIYKCNESAL